MKSVPFFDYPRLWLDQREELLGVVDETASSGGFIMQKALTDFELFLANYLNSKHAIGVGNATDAMEIYLQAIGLHKGDEIIISSHTMLATASAVVAAGGTPVPVDIGEDNLIDANAVASAINSRTVGIMPTQLNGRTCNMDFLQKEADKHGLFIVEDAAQAIGSKFKEKNAGTFGLASCISFFPAKVLGCIGDAGAILTSDEEIYQKCYQIHDHGRDVNGEVLCWGRNSRLDNIQAAILNLKLPGYPNVITKRRQIASIYQEQLGQLEELKLPPAPDADPDHFDVFQNYELVAERRDDLKNYLSSNGVGTLVQWGGKAIHQYTNLGFNQDLEKTNRFFNGCIMLPMNAFLSKEDVEYVCEVIKEFYKS